MNSLSGLGKTWKRQKVKPRNSDLLQLFVGSDKDNLLKTFIIALAKRLTLIKSVTCHLKEDIICIKIMH